MDLSFSKEALKENQKDMVTGCDVWVRGQWSPDVYGLNTWAGCVIYKVWST